MSSRRSMRQLLVVVLLGVLVGGGLMAVTPAGAEVSNAVATNWKKIWKKNLKPLADKRYYTKAASDAKYSTRTETAAGDAAANAATDTKLGGYYKKADTYSKAEADAKYAAAGSGYTKAESDAKYVASNALVRGSYLVIGDSSFESGSMSFGVTFASAPTVHIIPEGGAVPVGCSGTPAAPNAAAGHLCVFETGRVNLSGVVVANAAGLGGSADAFGFWLQTSKGGGAGYGFSRGSWAARPPVAGIVSPAALAAAPAAPSSGSAAAGAGATGGALR